MTVDAAPEIRRRSVDADGLRISFLEAGPADAPAVVLLHGLASDAETWDRAVAGLAERSLHVYAVDLVGHGLSDKPRRSYLLDDFAATLHAWFDAAGVVSATVCGHSLGGAISVAFAATHPDRVERLVLVSAGGLGREVHPILRAATLPIAPAVLWLATHRRLRRLWTHPRVHRMLRLTEDNLVNLRRAGRALGTPEGRSAFFASLRGVIRPSGQRGSFIEMGLLAAHVPTLLVWNEGDPVIPVAHARATAQHLSGSRLVVFEGSDHEPHRRDAPRFASVVAQFVSETDPAI